jgi:hypothetical protein
LALEGAGGVAAGRKGSDRHGASRLVPTLARRAPFRWRETYWASPSPFRLRAYSVTDASGASEGSTGNACSTLARLPIPVGRAGVGCERCEACARERSVLARAAHHGDALARLHVERGVEQIEHADRAGHPGRAQHARTSANPTSRAGERAPNGCLERRSQALEFARIERIVAHSARPASAEAIGRLACQLVGHPAVPSGARAVRAVRFGTAGSDPC